MMNINDLPNEMILHIFTFLPIHDRKNSRFVCKRWRRISYTWCLNKNVIFAVDKYLFHNRSIFPYFRSPPNWKMSQNHWPIQEEDVRAMRYWLHHSEKHMNFNSSKANDDFLEHCIEHFSNECTRFYAEDCKELTDRTLINVTRNLKKLREVNLGGCNFSKVGFLPLFTNMTLLTVVCVPNAPNLTDSCVAPLKSLANLTNLNLSGCSRLSDRGICAALGHEVRPTMRLLRLAHLRYLSDRAVTKIAPNLPNLLVLDLGSCPRLTDNSVAAIFTHNIKLECFNTANNTQLRDLSVGPTVNALKNLIHLTYGGSRSARGYFFRRIQLPALQIAEFSHVWLTAEEAMLIWTLCPSLEQFNYLEVQRYV